MMNFRSQFLSENRVEQSEEERFTDDDDNVSVADHCRERYFSENDGETMRSIERDHERLRIEQRFIDMNRQTGELTSIVKALTEKISNSKEGNNQDVLNTETSTRSDVFHHHISRRYRYKPSNHSLLVGLRDISSYTL